jgi:protein SCO1/2
MFRIKTLLSAFGLATLMMLTACSGLGAATPPPTQAPEGVTAVEPPGDPAQLTLVDQNGDELTRTDLEGKYTLFFFVYSNCPDFCPNTLANFIIIKQLLEAKAADVNFLFISVDGKRDTPERLTEYTQSFDPDFIAATADDEELQQVVSQFGAQYFINDEDGTLEEDYVVDHSTSAFLLDPGGRWIRLYSYGTDPQVMADDIGQLVDSMPSSGA